MTENVVHGRWLAHRNTKSEEDDIFSKGYLKIGQGASTAYLIGIQDGEDEYVSFGSTKYDKIKGLILESFEGSIYSCFNLAVRNINYTLPSKSSEVLYEYNCQIILKGSFGYWNVKEKYIKKLGSEIENLLIWAGLNPYAIEYSKISIKAKAMPSQYYTYGGYRLRFSVGVTQSSPQPAVTITPSGRIDISRRSSVGILDIYMVFIDLRMLVSILAGSTLETYRHVATTNHNPRKIGGRMRYDELEVYTTKNNQLNRDTWRPKIIIKLSDIDNFQEVLDIWRSKNEVILRSASVINLAVFNTTMALDAKYISILSALESLGREDETGFYISKPEFKRLKSAMRSIYDVPAIPDELKDSISNRISGANEKVLRLKILNLIEESFDIIRDRTDFAPDELAKIMTETRNAIAHGDVGHKNAVMKNTFSFVSLSRYAGYLLLYRFYTLIGIKSEVAIKCIISSSSQENYSIRKDQVTSVRREGITEDAII